MTGGSWRATWTRRRRRVALLAALLWVIGFELGPDLHQATHADAAAHRHDAGGAVVPSGPIVHVLREGSHSHGGVLHRDHGAPRPAPVPSSQALAELTAPHHDATGHGAGSLAHRGLAFPSPPPAMVVPPRHDPPGVVIVPSARVERTGRDPLVAAARGPPAAPAIA